MFYHSISEMLLHVHVYCRFEVSTLATNPPLSLFVFLLSKFCPDRRLWKFQSPVVYALLDKWRHCHESFFDVNASLGTGFNVGNAHFVSKLLKTIKQVIIIQSNLDISNSDISNSAILEASMWIKKHFVAFSNHHLALGTFLQSQIHEVQINLHFW